MVFASVSGKLNRMDVTGEKLSSAHVNIWGSQEETPHQNTFIPSWMLPLPTASVLREKTQAWQEEQHKVHTEKALANGGI